MAFESVSVPSLRSALTQCKNTLNHSKTDELINNISNTSVWQTTAQPNLKKALTKLKDERYKELESKISSYFTIASYIERYQFLQKENERLESEYASLSARLYYEETYTSTSTASDGTRTTSTYTRMVKDLAVEAAMASIRRQIEENKQEMEEIVVKVSNSI